MGNLGVVQVVQARVNYREVVGLQDVCHRSCQEGSCFTCITASGGDNTTTYLVICSSNF